MVWHTAHPYHPGETGVTPDKQQQQQQQQQLQQQQQQRSGMPSGLTSPLFQSKTETGRKKNTHTHTRIILTVSRKEQIVLLTVNRKVPDDINLFTGELP